MNGFPGLASGEPDVRVSRSDSKQALFPGKWRLLFSSSLCCHVEGVALGGMTEHTEISTGLKGY